MTKKNSSKKTASKTLRSPEPRLPSNWDEIAVGDLVLSCEDDPADGFWQALVVKRNGDKVTLQWQHRLMRRTFVKDRHTLALICGPDGQLPTLGPRPEVTANDTERGAPAQAGDTFLAQEDGPIRQWWPVTVLEASGDALTLEWRDYPEVPPVQRSRSRLAVTYRDAEKRSGAPR